jgi:ketosteroid isomerase-like protein
MAVMKAGFAYACALLGVIVALAVTAFAQDADLKKQLVEQNAAPYRESFNRQDVPGVVATYATGAIIVNPAGPHTDIPKFVEGMFKAGPNRIENEIDQVWPLASDTALAVGKWRVTGKNQSGAPIDIAGHWTATYVREGGKWKVRMTSIIPQPPPAK